MGLCRRLNLLLGATVAAVIRGREAFLSGPVITGFYLLFIYIYMVTPPRPRRDDDQRPALQPLASAHRALHRLGVPHRRAGFRRTGGLRHRRTLHDCLWFILRGAGLGFDLPRL